MFLFFGQKRSRLGRRYGLWLLPFKADMGLFIKNLIPEQKFCMFERSEFTKFPGISDFYRPRRRVFCLLFVGTKSKSSVFWCLFAGTKSKESGSAAAETVLSDPVLQPYGARPSGKGRGLARYFRGMFIIQRVV